MKRDIRLLIVDDNVATRYALRRRLVQHGYQVLEAGTGQDGLDIITQEQVDGLVLDVNLPDMSGVEVLETIRNEPAIADTPCVAITGENQRLVIEQLVSRRVLDILLKPMVLTRDLPRLQRVLMKALPTAV